MPSTSSTAIKSGFSLSVFSMACLRRKNCHPTSGMGTFSCLRIWSNVEYGLRVLPALTYAVPTGELILFEWLSVSFSKY